MLTNDMKEITLLEPCFLYTDTRERLLINKSDSSLVKKQHELWDIILDCGINSLLNVSNFTTLPEESAKNPIFIISKMQLRLGTFWSGIKIEEINILWDTCKLNNKNIMDC